MLSSFADGRLFGERSGDDAPWVLALHGWARTKDDFRQVLMPRRADVDGTSSAISAIALDLPGFGSSPAPPHAWGSLEYAHVVAEVLNEMADKVVVLGHSFGGCVAIQLAVERPERVAGLVLTGVPLYRAEGQRRPSLRYRFHRSANRLGLWSDARLEAARRRHGSADYRAATGVVRQVLVRVIAEDYTSVLARLTCPVELLWGDADTTVTPAVAERAADEIHARLELLEGVGHLTPTHAPDALRAAVLRLRP